VETKDDLLFEMCNTLGLQLYQTTIGSSVPRRFFSDLLDYFELDDEGDAVSACKQLLSKAGQEWQKEYSSESTPSGGGGTITVSGMKALRNAISLLLDEIESEVENIESLPIDTHMENEWTLLRGQTIVRKKLHDIYGGIRQGGISPSIRTNNVFLFSDDAANYEHGYERDYWEDDFTFIYCGDGQSGNQTLDGRNGTILNHIKHGRRLRLFSPVSGIVTYLGELQIDSNNPYTFKRGKGRDGREREVVMFKLKRVISSSENSLQSDDKLETISFGSQYRHANEDIEINSIIDVFERDPNLLDRALKLHAITQNIVASWVEGEGLMPLSPNRQECDFDIAWESDYGRVVCEIKSINSNNEIHQFRLGLGQILEYAHFVSATPILVFSRMPERPEILNIAHNAGVRVLWPEILHKYSPRDVRNIRHH
jgi:hypothetical protein